MHLLELSFAFSPDGGSGATEAFLFGTAALALLAWMLRHSVPGRTRMKR